MNDQMSYGEEQEMYADPPAPPLLYNGRDLDLCDSRNGRTPAEVLKDIHYFGIAFVELEPGDATRYQLYIIRPVEPEAAGQYLVVRIAGGDIIGASYVSKHDPSFDVEALANGNEWSAKLLGYYLKAVFTGGTP